MSSFSPTQTTAVVEIYDFVSVTEEEELASSDEFTEDDSVSVTEKEEIEVATMPTEVRAIIQSFIPVPAPVERRGGRDCKSYSVYEERAWYKGSYTKEQIDWYCNSMKYVPDLRNKVHVRRTTGCEACGRRTLGPCHCGAMIISVTVALRRRLHRTGLGLSFGPQ